MATGSLYLRLYVRGPGRPTVHPAAQRAYDLLAPLARHDADSDWPLLRLLSALSKGEAPVWDLAEYPGAATFLAPAVAPVEWLPWLARIVGARLAAWMTETQQRFEIANPSGWRRAGIDDLQATIASHLTGRKLIIIRERDGSAGHITIRTRAAETPDPAGLEAMIRARLLYGLKLDYRALDERDWQEVADTWATWQDVADANQSWHNVDTTTT